MRCAIRLVIMAAAAAAFGTVVLAAPVPRVVTETRDAAPGPQVGTEVGGRKLHT